MSVIVALYHTSGNVLTYLHTNNSIGTLFSVLHSSTCKLFNQLLKKDDWIKDILQATTHQNTTVQPEETASWFCDYIFCYFEGSFSDVAKNKGLIKIKKLNAVQAATM